MDTCQVCDEWAQVAKCKLAVVDQNIARPLNDIERLEDAFRSHDKSVSVQRWVINRTYCN